MSKPTFVFVPGSWHTPEIYAESMKELQSYGYSTIGVPLASVGADPAHANFDGDVQGIRSELTALVEEGKDIILVSHSYAGMPASEAALDLGKVHRQGRNLKGGIVRLVYINALAMPEGFQPTAGGAQIPPWMKLDEERQVFNVLPHDAKEVFYNDLSSEEGDVWAAKLLPESAGVGSSTVTHAAWRYIPSTFIAGSKDKSTITPEVVDFMISSARQQVPSAFDVVEKCEDGGHCLMISHPGWLTTALRRAAGEAA